MTSILLVTTFYAAFLAGVLIARGRSGADNYRPPAALLAVVAITAGPSVLQFPFPVILDTLRRDQDRLLGGQWWRLVTPLVVQDGGAIGTVSNLTLLVLLGGVATLLLGWRRWLLLYVGTGIASEIVAYAWLRQGFAGNSIANVGVAAGLVVLALRARRASVATLAVVALVSGLLLLAAGNLHGAAFVIGLTIAVPLTVRPNVAPGQPAPAPDLHAAAHFRTPGG